MGIDRPLPCCSKTSEKKPPLFGSRGGWGWKNAEGSKGNTAITNIRTGVKEKRGERIAGTPLMGTSEIGAELNEYSLTEDYFP